MPKIEISEETFEKIKDQLDESKYEHYSNYVIIRSRNAGCFAGVIIEQDDAHRKVVMTDVRRLWYWDGAMSATQLAEEGVKKPKNCKFTQPAKKETIYDVVEIIDVDKTAQKNIREVWEWKA